MCRQIHLLVWLSAGHAEPPEYTAYEHPVGVRVICSVGIGTHERCTSILHHSNNYLATIVGLCLDILTSQFGSPRVMQNPINTRLADTW